MKNLYHKNKAAVKIHPSPSSPSPSPDSALSALKFLPAAILTLATILTIEDREVLAYLITNPSSEKKKCKKHLPHHHCGCFECYTSYWVRWDSSPNRELIHQVIEAFEEHHSSNKDRPNSKNHRNKKNKNSANVNVLEQENEVTLVGESEEVELVDEMKVEVEETVAESVTESGEEEEEMVQVSSPCSSSHQHKSIIGRKIFPDVMGLFTSRIWEFWGTNN